MITKTISIEYRAEGVLTDVYSAILSSSDNSYGIKKLNGDILIPAESVGNSDVFQESTGIYSYTVELEENTVYIVSWEIITEVGNTPQYRVQQIGPFSSSGGPSGVTSVRGKFTQNSDSTLFLQVTNLSGMSLDPDTISLSIYDSDNNIITDANGVELLAVEPLKIQTGYFAWDWLVKSDQAPGQYSVAWTYTLDSNEYTVVQIVKIAAENINQSDGYKLYSRVIVEMRAALECMIWQPQHIPVYQEKSKMSSDNQNFSWTFTKWNPSGIQIILNDEIVTDGLVIDNFKGRVSFDVPLTKYDTVFANYSFKWFSDEELDRFLSNSLNLLNQFPPQTKYDFSNFDQRWIPVVLYGAAIDALRSMMLSLQFAEPQLVFGSQDRADKVFSNLESLKKNYEETWKLMVEQKKYGSYRGLTRTMIVPEFALPGGRSRWFRYLFTSGS